MGFFELLIAGIVAAGMLACIATLLVVLVVKSKERPKD